MNASKPHSEPCPVCLRDDAWELECDFGTGGEMEVIRCQNCQWPPTTPHTVEEWRRRHFISPYLKDLEAMVADRDERIRSLEEQLDALHNQLGGESMRCEKAESDLKRTLEQLEALRGIAAEWLIAEHFATGRPGMSKEEALVLIDAEVVNSNPASVPNLMGHTTYGSQYGPSSQESKP